MEPLERQETEVREGKGPAEAMGCWLFRRPVSPGTSLSLL